MYLPFGNISTIWWGFGPLSRLWIISCLGPQFLKQGHHLKLDNERNKGLCSICLKVYFIIIILTCFVLWFVVFCGFSSSFHLGPPLPHHRSAPYIFYTKTPELSASASPTVPEVLFLYWIILVRCKGFFVSCIFDMTWCLLFDCGFCLANISIHCLI